MFNAFSIDDARQNTLSGQYNIRQSRGKHLLTTITSLYFMFSDCILCVMCVRVFARTRIGRKPQSSPYNLCDICGLIAIHIIVLKFFYLPLHSLHFIFAELLQMASHCVACVFFFHHSDDTFVGNGSFQLFFFKEVKKATRTYTVHATHSPFGDVY